MASSSSSFVTLAGFSGSHLTTIRPFFPPNSQSKITPLDVETDVERLVEVRLSLECLRIPRFRAIQTRDVINNGAESTNHHRSPNGRRVERKSEGNEGGFVMADEALLQNLKREPFLQLHSPCTEDSSD